jgi:cellulose synthase/poly-beta-1,6-N-acetylglucosamine synthase-like glycosyltransferase
VTSVSIIVPTKKGREAILARTLAAYAATTPEDAQLVMPEEYATVGEAWNAGAARAQGDVLVFSTDDCVPEPGWLDAVLSTWDDEDSALTTIHPPGLIAAPVLLYPHGEIEAYGSMGGGMKLPGGYDLMRVRTSGVLAMRRETWEDVGEFAPIHYYVDDDWCWRAELAGWWVVVRDGFRLTHAHQPDRGVISQADAHRRVFLERAGERRKAAR